MDHKDSNSQPQPVPLLLLLEEFHGETEHSLFNPITDSSVLKTFLQLCSQVECLASAHGWILLLSRETSSLFFLNPLTGIKLDLPYRRSLFSATTFSAPPDSPNCVVFAVREDYLLGKIHFDVLRVWHENVWTRHEVEDVKECQKRRFSVVSKAVCRDGILYCLDSRGRVASFDPNLGIWNIICQQTIVKLRNSFFLEYKGDLFAVENRNEETYKLNFEDDEKVKAYWEVVKEDLDSDPESDWELVNEDSVSDLKTTTKIPNYMFLGTYGSCAVSNLGVKWHGKTWPPTSRALLTPIWITRAQN